MEGRIVSGFGRGARDLGIPTANLPVDDELTPWIADIKSGVYFGWASLRLPSSHPNQLATISSSTTTTTTTTTMGFGVYPMVMSIGRNNFYNNTTRSAEVHLFHKFDADFYGVEMRWTAM
ncbi:riboflavin kinase [Lentinus tigrinus ALCF2SS1-7]|uniref:Riboflavin kinase n=1 Tax=Lentinus tigrinus ALCF2SS1-6 TaxID=1328759 RepID=A0A5C2SR67_9APHY|nr:riboflavin kinase [Lentinus tigrinus ALCF2SS1-6]RPD80092.1 riboflavin kinase [Lentinus tigrinus ALCF2SS1-7]